MVSIMKTFKQLVQTLYEDGEGGEPANNTGAIPDKYVVSKKAAKLYKQKNAPSVPAGRKIMSPM